MMKKEILHSTQKRIVIALSGGVDSAVAAYLLLRSCTNQKRIRSSSETKHGSTYDVTGLHMTNWDALDEGNNSAKSSANNGSGRNYCVQSEKDYKDAKSISDFLGITMRHVNFSSDYWLGVFQPFIEGISDGYTLNPDVGCNSIIKFGSMKIYATKTLGADFVATGHYARLWHHSRQIEFDDYHSCDLDIIYKNPGLHSTPLYSSYLHEILEQSLANNPEREWIKLIDNENEYKSPLLLAGADLSKDQSYFLCGVKGNDFSNVIFPLGNLQKSFIVDQIYKTGDNERTEHINRKVVEDFLNYENISLHEMTVREIASMIGLPNAVKKDSMGICFIGKRNFSNFISEYLPYEPSRGNFIDIETGKIVGEHPGATYFTIGQGAKISGAEKKWFIAEKNKNNSDIFVCDDTHHPSLYSDKLYVKAVDFNWISGHIPYPLSKNDKIKALCRIRHLQPLVDCEIGWSDSDKNEFVFHFDRPLRAITPGQTAALYVGNGLICLGGGPIKSRGPSYFDMKLDLPTKLHPAGNNDLSVKIRLNNEINK